MKKTRTAALLLLILLAFSACTVDASQVSVSGDKEETAILETVLGAMLNADEKAYLSVFPEEMVKDYEETDVYGYFFMAEDMEAWLAASLSTYSTNYGKGIKISGTVTSMETEVEALGDANLDYYTYKRYVTEENTEAVRIATFNYKISGSSTDEEKTAKIYFVKQQGKWYLHPCFAFYLF